MKTVKCQEREKHLKLCMYVEWRNTNYCVHTQSHCMNLFHFYVINVAILIFKLIALNKILLFHFNPRTDFGYCCHIICHIYFQICKFNKKSKFELVMKRG